MVDTKPWWQSRTVIASLVGLLFILLRTLGLLPADLQEAEVVEVVLACTSALAIIFRVKATIPVSGG